MSKFCCLFNHYNSNRTINSYVFALLDNFSSLDCETIIISNSPLETTEGKRLLKERFKGKFVERENKGYDFGAWQYAMEMDLIPEDTEYLFLMNDSVFGPLYDFQNALEEMLSDQSVDFFGLTDSLEGQWHLQSYFLCFKRHVFTSPIFKKFFKKKFVSFSKKEVIEQGELELTSVLENAGFKGKAIFEYQKITGGNNNPFRYKNANHFFITQLITEMKFPFIKKEFIFSNPYNIEINGGVLAMLNTHTAYPVKYITEALQDRLSIKKEEQQRTEPLIDVINHIYYLNTAYRFLISLSELKKYNCRFIFNLSSELYEDFYFMNILTSSFKNAIIIKTSNVGKDIGGKLAMIDWALQLKEKSTFTILLHDKQSPHSSLGETWRKKLFRIIEPLYIPLIIKLFDENKKNGIVAAKEFIKNEFDKNTGNFDCTSNSILKTIIRQYGFSNCNFDFVGGTMFWIRTEILSTFFSEYSALEIRSTLERANVLDNNHGTSTHAWERMLSWIAAKQGFEIRGINEHI
jgi:rhamnosyltransferase